MIYLHTIINHLSIDFRVKKYFVSNHRDKFFFFFAQLIKLAAALSHLFKHNYIFHYIYRVNTSRPYPRYRNKIHPLIFLPWDRSWKLKWQTKNKIVFDRNWIFERNFSNWYRVRRNYSFVFHFPNRFHLSPGVKKNIIFISITDRT